MAYDRAKPRRGAKPPYPLRGAGAAGTRPSTTPSASLPPNELAGPNGDLAAVAGQVEDIVAAAEQTAEQLRVLAEARVRERIAEAQRAADMRVAAAEQEATEVLAEAQGRSRELLKKAAAEGETARSQVRSEIAALRVEAERRALEYARQVREEADARAAKVTTKARNAARDVLAQATELSQNLHALGDSLHTNADRLLRDVQLAHGALLERVPLSGGRERDTSPAGEEGPDERPGRARRGSAAPRRREKVAAPEQLDVPEFVPPGPRRRG